MDLKIWSKTFSVAPEQRAAKVEAGEFADPLAILDREPQLPVRSLKSRVQLYTKQALGELHRSGHLPRDRPRPSQCTPTPSQSSNTQIETRPLDTEPLDSTRQWQAETGSRSPHPTSPYRLQGASARGLPNASQVGP